MRVIEPRRFKKRRPSKKSLVLPAVILLILFGATSWLLKKPSPATEQSSQAVNNDSQSPLPPPPAPKPKQLKVLDGEGFRSLYEGVAYPNTAPIAEDLSITGNAQADERIRMLAESRGYKKRSVPVAPIVKIGDPNLSGDDLLQQKALDDWKKLKQKAKQANQDLRILSAYRSPQYQRSIFLSRLNAYGVSYNQIASGQADAQVNDLLRSTSVPGYSRHHTGYTVDFQCNGGTLEAFVKSACYAWLSANNFEEAKLAGYIPSYPEGVSKQGPDPEPWEYVWVGTDLLYE